MKRPVTLVLVATLLASAPAFAAKDFQSKVANARRKGHAPATTAIAADNRGHDNRGNDHRGGNHQRNNNDRDRGNRCATESWRRP